MFAKTFNQQATVATTTKATMWQMPTQPVNANAIVIKGFTRGVVM